MRTLGYLFIRNRKKLIFKRVIRKVYARNIYKVRFFLLKYNSVPRDRETLRSRPAVLKLVETIVHKSG